MRSPEFRLILTRPGQDKRPYPEAPRPPIYLLQSSDSHYDLLENIATQPLPANVSNNAATSYQINHPFNAGNANFSPLINSEISTRSDKNGGLQSVSNPVFMPPRMTAEHMRVSSHNKLSKPDDISESTSNKMRQATSQEQVLMTLALETDGLDISKTIGPVLESIEQWRSWGLVPDDQNTISTSLFDFDKQVVASARGFSPCSETAICRVDVASGINWQKQTEHPVTQIKFEAGASVDINQKLNSLVDNDSHQIIKYTLNGDGGVGHVFTFETLQSDAGEKVGYFDQSNIGRYSWAEWMQANPDQQTVTNFHNELDGLFNKPHDEFGAHYAKLFLAAGSTETLTRPDNLKLEVKVFQVDTQAAINKVDTALLNAQRMYDAAKHPIPAENQTFTVELDDETKEVEYAPERLSEYFKLKLGLTKSEELPDLTLTLDRAKQT